MNDKSLRGSPYIQAKVVRAKERWLMEKTPEEIEEIKKFVQSAQEKDPLPK